MDYSLEYRSTDGKKAIIEFVAADDKEAVKFAEELIGIYNQNEKATKKGKIQFDPQRIYRIEVVKKYH